MYFLNIPAFKKFKSRKVNIKIETIDGSRYMLNLNALRVKKTMRIQAGEY